MWKETGDTDREAYAHLPQSTTADYLHQALVKLEYLLPKGAEMVQEGFDSLIVECYEEQVGEVDRLVGVAMDKELYWKGRMFKIPYDKKEVWQ